MQQNAQLITRHCTVQHHSLLDTPVYYYISHILQHNGGTHNLTESKKTKGSHEIESKNKHKTWMPSSAATCLSEISCKGSSILVTFKKSWVQRLLIETTTAWHICWRFIGHGIRSVLVCHSTVTSKHVSSGMDVSCHSRVISKYVSSCYICLKIILAATFG